MMRSIPAWSRSVLLLALAVAVYFQTWVDLWPYWENKNATYTHGTLVALVTLWLIWRARPALDGVPLSGSPPALVPVLVLSAAWLLAAKTNVLVAYAMLWPALAFSIVWAGVGRQAALKLAFPLSYLYFAIPIWDYLKPPLQTITSAVVGFLTGLAGITATIDGPYITVRGGTIYIALDCSGAHFLCVSLAVAVLAGVLRGDRLPTRLLILLLAAALSMIFNWLRVLLIVLAYLHPGLKHTLETIGHLTFGWWVFALDLLVFYLALRFVPTSPGRPEQRSSPGLEKPHSGGIYRLAAAVLAAALLPVSSWALSRGESYPGTVDAPIALPGARAAVSPDPRWQPYFEGPAWEHRVAYLHSDGPIIEVYRNEYHRQSQGKELISNGAVLFDPAVFATHSSAIVHLRRGGRPTVEANRVELVDKLGNPWLALYTYVVDQETIANALHVQLITALRSLYGRTTAGVLAVAVPCARDCAALESQLRDVMLQIYDAYQSAPRYPVDRAHAES